MPGYNGSIRKILESERKKIRPRPAGHQRQFGSAQATGPTDESESTGTPEWQESGGGRPPRGDHAGAKGPEHPGGTPPRGGHAGVERPGPGDVNMPVSGPANVKRPEYPGGRHPASSKERATQNGDGSRAKSGPPSAETILRIVRAKNLHGLPLHRPNGDHAAKSPAPHVSKDAVSDKIRTNMREMNEGTLHSGSKHGPLVKNRAQALAISFSQLRHGRR